MFLYLILGYQWGNYQVIALSTIIYCIILILLISSKLFIEIALRHFSSASKTIITNFL